MKTEPYLRFHVNITITLVNKKFSPTWQVLQAINIKIERSISTHSISFLVNYL